MSRCMILSIHSIGFPRELKAMESIGPDKLCLEQLSGRVPEGSSRFRAVGDTTRACFLELGVGPTVPARDSSVLPFRFPMVVFLAIYLFKESKKGIPWNKHTPTQLEDKPCNFLGLWGLLAKRGYTNRSAPIKWETWTQIIPVVSQNLESVVSI